jgi:hypothetical protein
MSWFVFYGFGEQFLQDLNRTTDSQKRFAQMSCLPLEILDLRLTYLKLPFKYEESRLQLFTHV